MSLLRVEELSYRIGDRQLLEAVSFSVAAGEVVGLIGPNAAGKTTLIRLLAGLLEPATGHRRWRDRPYGEWAARQLARAIGYLPQGAQVHWALPVEAVVTLGRLPHLQWWQRPAATDRRAVEQALAAADITHLRERTVTELSGGERARVLLARVLAAEPALILADEPTAALDPLHQLRVMEILRQRAGAGEAVMAVLHDLTLAGRFCDRLLLLDRGRLVAAGTPAEVLQPDRLAQVYGVAVQSLECEGSRLVVPWRVLT